MKLDNDDLKIGYPKISDTPKKNNMEDTTELDNNLSLKKETTDTNTNDFNSPLLPPISKKIEDESDESVLPKLNGLYLLIY